MVLYYNIIYWAYIFDIFHTNIGKKSQRKNAMAFISVAFFPITILYTIYMFLNGYIDVYIQFRILIIFINYTNRYLSV